MIHDLLKAAGVAGEVVELVGVLIIVSGFVYAFVSECVLGRDKSGNRLNAFRSGAKKSMMLGLDFLVAGDIIRTVTVNPSFTGVATLGLLVLIRTALVFTIHLETEGHWPWDKKSD